MINYISTYSKLRLKFTIYKIHCLVIISNCINFDENLLPRGIKPNHAMLITVTGCELNAWPRFSLLSS